MTTEHIAASASNNIDLDTLVCLIKTNVTNALMESLNPFVEQINNSIKNYNVIRDILQKMPEYKNLIKQNDDLKSKLRDLHKDLSQSIEIEVKERLVIENNTEDRIKTIYNCVIKEEPDSFYSGHTTFSPVQATNVVVRKAQPSEAVPSAAVPSAIAPSASIYSEAESSDEEEEPQAAIFSEAESTDEEEEKANEVAQEVEVANEVAQEVEEEEEQEEEEDANEVAQEEEEDANEVAQEEVAEEEEEEEEAAPTVHTILTQVQAQAQAPNTTQEDADADADEEVFIVEIEVDDEVISFYVNDEENGDVYEVLENEEIGEKVGELIDGELHLD